MVTRGFGKEVDGFLVDRDPFAGAKLAAHPFGERCGGFDVDHAVLIDGVSNPEAADLRLIRPAGWIWARPLKRNLPKAVKSAAVRQ